MFVLETYLLQSLVCTVNQLLDIRSMAHLASALRFVDAFPEAEALNVTLLTEEKRGIIVKPQCSRAIVEGTQYLALDGGGALLHPASDVKHRVPGS